MKKSNYLVLSSVVVGIVGLILLFLLPLITVEYNQYAYTESVSIPTEFIDFVSVVNGFGVIFGGSVYSAIAVDRTSNSYIINYLTSFNWILFVGVLLIVISIIAIGVLHLLKKNGKYCRTFVFTLVLAGFLVILAPVFFYVSNSINTWLTDISEFNFAGSNVHGSAGSFISSILLFISAILYYMSLPKTDEGEKR